MNVHEEFKRLVRTDAAVANMVHARMSLKEMVVLLANSRQGLLNKLVEAERLRPATYVPTSDAMMRRWGDLQCDSYDQHKQDQRTRTRRE
jgi:hypothetical protein